MILVCPVINNFIKHLTRNGFLLVLFVVWAFYYSVGFAINDVYLPVVRAVFFYLLGAFIKTHCPQKISKKSFTALAVLCVLIWALMSFFFYNSYYIFTGSGTSELFAKKSPFEKMMILGFKCANITILLPCFAFCFFRVFQNLNIGKRPFINKIASLTFGVYLIHDSDFFRMLIWKKIFDMSGVQFKSDFFVLIAIGDVLAVFALCCLIDFFRQKFAEPRYLKLYDFAANKLKAFCLS